MCQTKILVQKKFGVGKQGEIRFTNRRWKYCTDGKPHDNCEISVYHTRGQGLVLQKERAIRHDRVWLGWRKNKQCIPVLV